MKSPYSIPIGFAVAALLIVVGLEVDSCVAYSRKREIICLEAGGTLITPVGNSSSTDKMCAKITIEPVTTKPY